MYDVTFIVWNIYISMYIWVICIKRPNPKNHGYAYAYWLRIYLYNFYIWFGARRCCVNCWKHYCLRRPSYYIILRLDIRLYWWTDRWCQTWIGIGSKLPDLDNFYATLQYVLQSLTSPTYKSSRIQTSFSYIPAQPHHASQQIVDEVHNALLFVLSIQGIVSSWSQVLWWTQCTSKIYALIGKSIVNTVLAGCLARCGSKKY